MSDSESQFGAVSLTVILLLFVYAVAGSFFEHKHFHLIHETGLGILLGVSAGGLFYLIAHEVLAFMQTFNESFFFYILLPIIIFSGGYNLNKRRFFQNFLYIMLFGLIGTIITFIIVLGLTYLINKQGLITVWGSGDVITLEWHQIMIFSATICATDSVAALTMIKADKYPKLFSVMFGEGMVNDAVAIIIFISVELLETSESNAGILTLKLSWLFIKEFVGSFLVGVAFGLFTSFIFRNLRFLTESCIIEVAAILYMGYASFTICELFHLSGVISVLVSGVVMAHYNFYNISPIGQVSSRVTLQTLSLICEAFIYLYLGTSIWRLMGDGSKEETSKASWTFVLLELGICFFARGMSMFLITMITQIFTGRKNFRLSFWELNIVWFAGLIRGSIAYALISRLQPDPHATDLQLEKEQVEIIQNSVLMMVILTTIMLGGMMPFYIAFNLKFQEKGLAKVAEQEHEPVRHTLLSGEIQGGLGEPKEDKRFRSKIQKFVRRIDEDYFKRWFIFDYENRKDDLKMQKKMQKQTSNDHQGAGARRQTVQKSIFKSVRQQSMGMQNIIVGHENKESISVAKVAFRSTLKSKFTGAQDIIFTVDIPLDQQDAMLEDDDSELSAESIAQGFRGQELRTQPKIDEAPEQDENQEDK